MSEALQIATLVSAILGWLTVLIGGITVWTRFKIQLTELSGKLDTLTAEYKQLRADRASYEEREQAKSADVEARLRVLEKG